MSGLLKAPRVPHPSFLSVVVAFGLQLKRRLAADAVL